MTAIDTIKNSIRTQTTEMILDCIMNIGGGILENQEERMVRACLMDVYEERTSSEELDVLLDKLGM